LPVVAIIGVDEAGKSTLISQLKDKYPNKIDVLAFPTLPLREKLATLSIDYTDIHSILNYHIRFMLDFSEQNQNVGQYYHDDKLLILDRYFYCSLAYLRNAVLQHHTEQYWTDHIRPLLWGYYSDHINNPDFVIWLVRDKDELGGEYIEIQKSYREELYDWEDKYQYQGSRFEKKSIEGRQPDTFARVERALQSRGFL
jgi:thymidylate kinase